MERSLTDLSMIFGIVPSPDDKKKWRKGATKRKKTYLCRHNEEMMFTAPKSQDDGKTMAR
jgi:hypothetical protein